MNLETAPSVSNRQTKRVPKPMNEDAMDAPIKRPWCSDPKPLTPNRILQILQSKGEFVVSWQYRNDNLRKVLRRMADLKMIKRRRGRPGQDEYVAAPKDPTP